MVRNLLIIACFLSISTVQAQKAHRGNKHSSKETTATIHHDTLTGSPLPPLKVVQLNGKIITNKDVKDDHNLFMLLFNPECDHCQNETLMLKRNIDLFIHSKILLVCTPNMLPYLGNFEKNMEIIDNPKIMVGMDSAGMVDNLFMYKGLPQMNIYDANRKLIKMFYGDFPIDSLKPYIQ